MSMFFRSPPRPTEGPTTTGVNTAGLRSMAADPDEGAVRWALRCACDDIDRLRWLLEWVRQTAADGNTVLDPNLAAGLSDWAMAEAEAYKSFVRWGPEPRQTSADYADYADPCGCPQPFGPKNTDIRCHVCGEMVNVRCWRCRTPRGEGPCPTQALKETTP